MSSTPAAQAVVDCYSFLHAFARCGITDFTDGMYHNDDSVSYEQAQVNQAEYLLDEVNCKAGSIMLDIGCGNGRILAAAQARGAAVTGITVSPEQAHENNRRGLTTLLLNYRDIPASWNGRFDGIIANGSIEHFAQLDDALAGRQGAIYSEMFAIMHRILKPRGKVATTVIHLRMAIDLKEVARGTKALQRGTLPFHSAQLVRDFGGWHPSRDQLVESARPFFTLARREDGTDDYRRTSEEWIRAGKRIICRNPKAWLIFLRKFFGNPGFTIGFLDDLFLSQSWATQFRDWRGQGTPTSLFRDTWGRVP